MHRQLPSLLMCALGALPSPATAAIIAAEGNAEIAEIQGRDLRFGGTESASMLGFDERQLVEIGEDDLLFVDYLIGVDDQGLLLEGAWEPTFDEALPPGLYASHMLHYDPPGSQGGHLTGARFVFDAPVVGIITNGVYLIESDARLGGEAIYSPMTYRGVGAGDWFFVEDETGLGAISFWVLAAYIDQMRVITAVDADGDGVPIGDDLCPDTVEGAVDAMGCSVAAYCPCDVTWEGRDWKSHGAYVTCVIEVAEDFVDEGVIDKQARQELVRAAAGSRCGH